MLLKGEAQKEEAFLMGIIRLVRSKNFLKN